MSGIDLVEQLWTGRTVLETTRNSPGYREQQVHIEGLRI